MPRDDPWSRSILSPEPHTSDEEDYGDNDPSSGLPTFFDIDDQLERDLDVNFRDNHIGFKDTPFTKAKSNGSKNAASQKSGAKQVAAEPRKKRGNIQPATVDGSKPVEVEKPAPAKKGKAKGKDAAVEQQGGAGASMRSQWRRGWYDNHNEPVPSDPPLNRNLVDDIDRLPSNGKASKTNKGHKAATKGKKSGKVGDSERVTFRRIRELLHVGAASTMVSHLMHTSAANAGPTEDFPIVKGIEKQKGLPVKAKKATKRKRTSLPSLTPDPTDEPIPSLNIDSLVGGIASDDKKDGGVDDPNGPDEECADIEAALGKEEQMPAKKRKTLNQPPNLSKYFCAPMTKTQSSKTGITIPSSQNSSQLPSLHRSGPTIGTDQIDTPVTSGRPPSDPSTLTHIPSFNSGPQLKPVNDVTVDVSSSQLPYSSPLMLKSKNKAVPDDDPAPECRLIKPKPRKNIPLEMLEAQAYQSYLSVSPDMFEEESKRRREITIVRETEILQKLSPFAAEKPPIQRKKAIKAQTDAHHVASQQKRPGSPDNSLQQQKYARLDTDKPSRLEPYDPTPQSSSPEWSTLPKKAQRSTKPPARSSSPKFSGKFRMPVQIFPRRAARVPSPPHTQVPKLTTIKPSMFVPSAQKALTHDNKPGYTVKTIRGTQYCPTASARQDEAISKHESDVASTRSSRTLTENAIQLQAPKARQHGHQVNAAEPTVSDWTQAWKRPTEPNNSAYEQDAGSERFRYARADMASNADRRRRIDRSMAF